MLGKGSLRVDKASYEVSLLAQKLVPNAGALTFDGQRPPAGVARSTGGPLMAAIGAVAFVCPYFAIAVCRSCACCRCIATFARTSLMKAFTSAAVAFGTSC